MAIKKIIFAAVAFFITLPFFAEISARDAAAKASEFESVTESVKYIEKIIPTITVASEKRALYVFLGSLQEQMALYKNASSSYAAAAGIAAGDAEGMPKKTPQQLVLDAVRTALCYGDYATADSYLNSAVRNSRDEKIQAYIKLYEVWSALCKVENASEIDESVIILKTYSTFKSMELLRPSILLTLWYITGESDYGNQIVKAYPKSPEAAVVKGTVQMMPAPFWYFMPKKGEALAGAVENAVEAQNVAVEKSSDEDAEKNTASIKKQQLGLFSKKENADDLVRRLKEKGFAPYITKETRPSGNTYFIVVVDENSDGSMGTLLRSAGFECYPVF